MRLRLFAVGLLNLVATPVFAHCPPADPGAARVLPPARVWPSGTPDMRGWPATSPVPVTESTTPDGIVFNVTEPTFQAFLPAAGCASGAGVIIAPGGGFRLLAIRKEGTEVAQWLAAHGVAVFVLKYRLAQNAVPSLKRPASLTTPDEILGQPGVADAIEALRQIRAQAAVYGVDPHRIGAIGFSAGAHIVSMLAITPPAAERPAFVAPIYGGPFTQVMPPLPPATAANALPPIFLAMAQDDPAAGSSARSFYAALFAAGYRPELHYYLRGGHGFGMTPIGSTSDHFIDEFYWWIEALGMTKPALPQ
jgi:acetyl esterase/lipase